MMLTLGRQQFVKCSGFSMFIIFSNIHQMSRWSKRHDLLKRLVAVPWLSAPCSAVRVGITCNIGFLLAQSASYGLELLGKEMGVLEAMNKLPKNSRRCLERRVLKCPDKNACFCQRNRKYRARKTQVLASVCSQVMKGRGGVGGNMLTFLVLLPLHVATLHRCLVVLLRCILGGVGWGGTC